MELYSHQREALKNLRSGCILCGGTGSGKSLTAISFFYEKFLFGDIERTILPLKAVDLLIITIPRKRDTFEWESELKKLGLDKGDNYISDGSKFNIMIDSWNNIEKYEFKENLFIIFDEQRAISYGVWSKSFIQLAKGKGNHWIILTATPGDTWMDYIPVFVANGFYKNKTDFCNRHVIWSRFSKYPKVDRYVDVGTLMHYRDLIIIKMPCERKTIQKHIDIKVKYNKVLSDYIIENKCDPDTKIPYKNAGEIYLKMRQLVNSDPSRCDSLYYLTEKHNKIIIFYTYVFEAQLIKTWCANNDITYAEWNGQKHEPIPNTDKWIYIVQYASGCEGWNCIETDAMVFYSQSCSYRQMIQAAGRIDRINTPYTELYYYHLISDSKIDRSIRYSLSKKRNFNENAFIKKLF